MWWLIIVGLVLFVLSEPLLMRYNNSAYARKRKKDKKKKLPYNFKWTQLVSKIKDAEKYDDWKTSQTLRKELLWLETIYSHEYSLQSRSRVYSQNSVDKEKIIANFKKEDLIGPEVFSLADKRHKIYTENVAIAFEQTLSKVNENKPDFLDVLNPISANISDKNLEGNQFRESFLPYPKDFITKALSFQYLCNTEDPEYALGIQIMRPAYFTELKEKLTKFQ